MAISFVVEASNAGKGPFTNAIVSAWTGYSGSLQPAVGDVILVWATFDNSTATTPTITSIGKPSQETNNWVLLASHDSPQASSAAGVRGELWGLKVSYSTGGVWASTLSITCSASPVASSVLCQTFRGASLSLRGTVGGGAGATSAACSPLAGDLVIGAASAEGNATLTGDSDTTNGSWSTILTRATSGGGAAANCANGMQYKIVTASGTQTYNPSSVADGGSIAIALQPSGGVADGSHSWTATTSGDNGVLYPESIDDMVAQWSTNLYLGEDTYARGQFTDAGGLNAGETLLAWIAFNNSDAESPTVSSITVPAGETALWTRVWAGGSPSATPLSGVRGELWGITANTNWVGIKNLVVTLAGSGATVISVITSRWLNTALTPLASAVDTGVTPWSASVSAAAGSLVLGLGSTTDSATVGVGDSDGTGGASWSTRRFTSGEWPSYPVVERVFAQFQWKIPTSTATQTYDVTSSNGTDQGLSAIVVLGGTSAPPARTASGEVRWETLATGENGRLKVRHKARTPGGDSAANTVLGMRDQSDDSNLGPGPLAGDNMVFIIALVTTGSTTAPSVTSIGKPANETASWVKLGAWDDGAAPGVRSEIWAIRTTVAWPDVSNYNINLNTTKAATIGTMLNVRGGYGNGLELKEAISVDTGTSPWAPSSTAPEFGDLLIGIGSVRSNTATGNYTLDSDSTNAYWSQSGRGLVNTGTSSTSISMMIQHKMVEGSGTQTWDLSCTDTGATGASALIVLTPKPPSVAGIGTATGTWTTTATTAGKRDPIGSSTATATFVGTAAGSRLQKGDAGGTFDVTGTAAGERKMTGTATGATSWSATTLGSRVATGTATGADSWTGTATGVRIPEGAATGEHAWTATTSGARPQSGSATTTHAWSATTSGTTSRRGSAVAADTWAGSAAGATQHRGATTGAFAIDGTAAGGRVSSGGSSGGFAFTGSASSESVKQGSVTSETAWATSGQGSRTSAGSATGTTSWTATTQGIRTSAGSATGTTGWTGTSQGSRASTGAAAGATAWAGTAAAGAVRSGSATGSATWTPTASGVRRPAGSATGTTAWAGTSTGGHVAKGSVSGQTIWTTSTLGGAGRQGSAVGQHAWSGTATSGTLVLDITVDVGTTRVGTVAVSATRQSGTSVDSTRSKELVAVGATRQGWEVEETRLRPPLATVEATRQGWTVGATRRDRGE